MIPLTLLTTIIYGICFCLFYYCFISLVKRKWVAIRWRKLALYTTVFMAFGLSGEIFVNNAWSLVFGSPLWEYRLFPAHGGDVSYFFPFIWGSLGFFKYINDTTFHHFTPQQFLLPGIVMGSEAILVELLYNGTFLWLFGEYIFYYFPQNMGFFSHLSCWQVIPFYFMVGFATNLIITDQTNRDSHILTFLCIVSFYLMIIGALVLF